jgi:Spy/CpxP family protein refolding chaperone
MKATKLSAKVIGVAMGMVLLAGAAGAAHAERRGPQGAGLMLGVPLHSLNLTADQQTQIRSLLSASHAANRPILTQLRQAQSSLADTLLASPSADVSAQLSTINGLRAQLLQNGARTTQQLLGVLNQDQLAKAAQVKGQLSQLRAQMHQLMAPGQ